MQPTIPGEAEGKRKAIEEVIEQVKAGDKHAYQAIIVQFERQMYTYCYYILKNHAETEDAVQEIFIRAYEHLHLYKRQVSFSAWLYKMAYHHLINIKRKQNRFLNLIEHYKEQQPVVTVSQHDSVVYELLTYLTAEERHILLLKAVEQYTFEEISGIMGLKSATIRKKYERLRHKLMDRISQKGEVARGTIAGTNGIR
ncbi:MULTISPECIES: RNA polymerase sigma factor [Paenibacillus]|uniref:RNA polymerase sigma factor n=1 Tax=Paenibacillus TaxID=44249 RepID=UPI0017877F02|nr:MULTISPECIES: RNA polymerase sigma factor [Paenibacillus]QOT12708.1 RNA polymerase sigma factor [Paenibacillus sp. JNUCC-32]WFB61250.1 RNA polymerase sigma factor [Paenibacillus sp. BR1-192]GIP02700.1 RNA polymerase sigma factor [Paenibacillus lautus]